MMKRGAGDIAILLSAPGLAIIIAASHARSPWRCSVREAPAGDTSQNCAIAPAPCPLQQMRGVRHPKRRGEMGRFSTEIGSNCVASNRLVAGKTAIAPAA